MKVEFFRHNIDENDIHNVANILKSVFLTTGDAVGDFEKKLAAYLHIGHTVGLSSCTGALHLGLLAWGIGADDEVITTPMSFCATANSILQASATPVFVDVEEETGNINTELIEEKITNKTSFFYRTFLFDSKKNTRTGKTLFRIDSKIRSNYRRTL